MFFLGRNRRFDVTYAGKRTGPARFLPEGTYDITCAREFRYDGARQHYLNRALNAADLLLGIISMDDNAEAYWSDYDGDDIYGDFTVDAGTVTNERLSGPGTAGIHESIVEL